MDSRPATDMHRVRTGQVRLIFWDAQHANSDYVCDYNELCFNCVMESAKVQAQANIWVSTSHNS